MTLKRAVLIEYPAHPVLANSSVVYRRRLIENVLTSVEFLAVEIGTFIESGPIREGRGESAHFWVTGMEEGHGAEGMM